MNSTYISPSNVLVDGHYMYKLDETQLISCDLMDPSSYSPLNINGVISITTVDVQGEKLIMTGLSHTGKMVTGVYDYLTGELNKEEVNIMKEVSLEALNA